MSEKRPFEHARSASNASQDRGNLEARSATRPARIGRARIAHEDELRIERQGPARHRDLEPPKRHRAQTDLCASGARQRRDWLGRFSRQRIDSHHRAARVVRVEARAGADVDLVVAPRSEHDAPLRADEAGGRVARVARVAGPYVEPIPIPAEARARPQPRRPLHFVLREDAKRRLVHRVFANRGEPAPSGGVIEANLTDAIASQVRAEDELRRPTSQRSQTPMRHAAAADPSTVGLLELIAVDGIVEEIGEIREQVQLVSNEVGVGARHRAGAALLPVG
jgi:hypothetical protein